MVKGKALPKVGQTEWIHTASKRIFTSIDDYNVAVKSWNRKYGTMSEYDIQKMRIKEEREKELKERQELRNSLKKEIDKLVQLQNKRIREKKDYVARQNMELINTISGYKTQIKKLEEAIKICNESLTSYKKESTEKFNKENPFLEQKELNNLRAKLRKTYE